MKPAPFAFRPAVSLAEARRALAGDAAAKLSAGNQSLGPMPPEVVRAALAAAVARAGA